MLLLSSSPRQSPRRAAAFRPFRHFITDSSAKRWAWERSGIARGSGRFEPKRWERSGTSPVGLVLVSVRSAGTHCAMASYTNPSFIGPEKEKDHPWEGQVKGKKVMINGEWFPVNKLMDYMVNKGHAIGAAFAKLSKKEQADVLAGRSELAEEAGPALPAGCPRREWTGSGSGGCDVCMVVRLKARDDAPDLELTTCPRCRYAVCDNCRSDQTCCFCRDSNFGVPYGAPLARKPWETGYW